MCRVKREFGLLRPKRPEIFGKPRLDERIPQVLTELRDFNTLRLMEIKQIRIYFHAEARSEPPIFGL